MWETDPQTKPGHYWAVWKGDKNGPSEVMMVYAQIHEDRRSYAQFMGYDGTANLDDFSHWLPVEKPDLPDSLLPDVSTEATP